MGRGRAKAKQTKVARQLKYSTSATDLDRLRAELQADSGGSTVSSQADDADDADDYEDPYARYLDEDSDSDADISEGDQARR